VLLREQPAAAGREVVAMTWLADLDKDLIGIRTVRRAASTVHPTDETRYGLRSQVHATASAEATAFWDMAPCCLLEVDRRTLGLCITEGRTGNGVALLSGFERHYKAKYPKMIVILIDFYVFILPKHYYRMFLSVRNLSAVRKLLC
jgi:hypothetical protein